MSTAIGPTARWKGPTGWSIVTEWQEFRNPDFEVIKRLLNEKVIFDGRNLYDPKQMSDFGLTYYAIGRGRN